MSWSPPPITPFDWTSAQKRYFIEKLTELRNHEIRRQSASLLEREDVSDPTQENEKDEYDNGKSPT